MNVAPVRERGLKYEAKLYRRNCFSRSRKGAWIEIIQTVNSDKVGTVAPVRERGLKLHQQIADFVSPVRRSRKGAWIEMVNNKEILLCLTVAPVRERGLKFCCDIINLGKLWSLP